MGTWFNSKAINQFSASVSLTFQPMTALEIIDDLFRKTAKLGDAKTRMQRTELAGYIGGMLLHLKDRIESGKVETQTQDVALERMLGGKTVPQLTITRGRG